MSTHVLRDDRAPVALSMSTHAKRRGLLQVRRGSVLAGVLALTGLVAGCPSFHAEGLRDEAPSARGAGVDNARFLKVDGVDLRVLDEGPRGAPVVTLLHGFGSSLETWRGVAPRLAETYRVVSLDLKGFGLSGRPGPDDGDGSLGDYGPEAQARLVAHVLDQLGVKETAVVAHSWGSSVALAFAVAAKNRVTRLALLGAWIYDEQLPPFFRWAKAGGMGELLFSLYYKERPDERMARAFYDPERLEEAYVEEVLEMLDRPGTVAAALAAVRGQDYVALAQRYPEVKQPTLLLWGREDRVAPVAFGERLARDLAHARLIVYPRCGHFPQVEARTAVLDDLVAFLAGRDGGPR